MTDETGENLIEPIIFEEIEIHDFIRSHGCRFCGGHLFAKHAPDRKYTAHCPEHGAMMDHTYTTKRELEKIERDNRAARMKLRPKERRTEKEILSELGFGG